MNRIRKLPLVFRRYPQNQLLLVYKFLKKYQERNSFMPTMREVADKFETRHSTIGYWYKLMEEKGMIKTNPALARAVELLPLENKKESV